LTEKPAPPGEQLSDDCGGNEYPNNSVAVCNLGSPGKFKVINRKNEPVSLLVRVGVEVEGEGGNWRLTRAEAWLGPRSGSVLARDACLTLRPGETLGPRAWDGFDCTHPFGPNCNGPNAVGGRLRFVVLSCDKAQRFEGRPFEHLEYSDGLL
jgi:hypothetical protein